MQEEATPIPYRAASLIIRYTHNLLSEAEMDELDEWLVASDENVEVFENLTEGLYDKVFSPSELISGTEDLLDAWMVAGLIAREMEGYITDDEKRFLQSWAEESEAHKRLYQLFNDKANLQKFVEWLREVNRNADQAGMN